MNIGFYTNQLCERGTTVSLFDYAYYNRKILHNNSFIFYLADNPWNQEAVIQKFKREFGDKVFALSSFEEVDVVIRENGIMHLYQIKSGENDGKLSKLAKNCIHCVFTCSQPHGDIYASISPWVDGNLGKYAVVPHMVNLPNTVEDLREELGIPLNATVFGGYGGKNQFDINFVRETVVEIAKNNPLIYFLFANFNRFCEQLPNIIHLPMISDLTRKVKFINTCDAMLWARSDGETFGLAIAEFSTKNKPVIAMKIGHPAHVHLLGDKGLWYSTKEELTDILLNFERGKVKLTDWNCYKDYTPERVMEIFKTIYLS